MGDVVEGLNTVMGFFAIAFLITGVLLWVYSRSWRLTLVALFVALLLIRKKPSIPVISGVRLHFWSVFGADRPALLARELTKTFETLKGLPLSELRAFVEADSNQQRGECVVLVAGWTAPETDQVVSSEAMRILDLLLKEMPLKRAAALAAEITGERKNVLYQVALDKQKAE